MKNTLRLTLILGILAALTVSTTGCDLGSILGSLGI